MNLSRLNRLNNMRFVNKLRIVILGTTLIALFLACGLIIVFERFSFQQSTVQKLTTIAQVLDRSITPSVFFKDRMFVEENLKILKEEEHITAAVVYEDNGAVLAAYYRNPMKKSVFTPPSQKRGYQFEADYLYFFHDIVFDDEVIGTICIMYDLQEMETLLMQYARILVVVLLLAAALAFMATARLQRAVSAPVLNLAQVASRVTATNDYSARALPRKSRDELGGLVVNFNRMLDHIESRDKALEEEIAKRRLSEKALTESEDRFRTMAESITSGLIIMEKGKIVYVNKQATIITGYSEEELMNVWGPDLTASEDREKKEEIIKEIHKTGVWPEQVDTWMYRKDGSKCCVHLRFSFSSKANDTKYAGYVLITDITARKLAEEKLRDTTAFLDNIISSSTDPIIIGDEVGTIIRTNRAFLELLHCGTGDVKGKHIGEFAPVEKGQYESRAGTIVEIDDTFFQDAEEKMTELVERGSIAAWNSCYLGKDGKIVPVEQTISFVCNKFGERTGVVGISRDITERLKAEKEVLSARDFLEDIFKTSLDGIVVTDALGTITMVNAAAVKILGYTRKDLLGRKTQEFFETGNEVEARGKEIQKVLMEKGFVTGYEHRWSRKDGTKVYLEISMALLKDRNGTLRGSVLSFRDISKRKKDERLLVGYQEQLRSLASQLTLTEERERRRIATDLHDRIGQALAMSKIKLGALRESTASLDCGEDVDGIRDLIEQTIQDTRSLIFDLCPPFLYELGFEKAVEWLLDDIQAQHDITTHLKSDGKPKPFDDDLRVLLYQTIRELFINIVKHAEAKNARLTIRGDDHTLSLCVEDDGRGFDKGATPFHMQREGGFGLFRIQERLTYLGGEIKIKSKPGRGTKVFLKVPFKTNKHIAREGST